MVPPPDPGLTVETPTPSQTRAEAATAIDRDQTASSRDRNAEAHDATASSRDVDSDERDARANTRDLAFGRVDVDAAADRSAAWQDRQSAIADRTRARHDRIAAEVDRALAATERAALLIDQLTGAYRREAGFLELQREAVRAQRTGEPFVLAFVDVDHLKLVNDTKGHAAGDELLVNVATRIRFLTREYDVLVRIGGDEFLCGLTNISLEDARCRFETANAELASGAEVSMTVGLVQLGERETLSKLIDRADAAMYAVRAGAQDAASEPD